VSALQITNVNITCNLSVIVKNQCHDRDSRGRYHTGYKRRSTMLCSKWIELGTSIAPPAVHLPYIVVHYPYIY